MYDPDEEPEQPPEVDWDEWARNRFKGGNRWWLIWAVLMVSALTVLWLSGNSWIPAP